MTTATISRRLTLQTDAADGTAFTFPVMSTTAATPILDLPDDEFKALTTSQMAAEHRHLKDREQQEKQALWAHWDKARMAEREREDRKRALETAASFEAGGDAVFDSAAEMSSYCDTWCDTRAEILPCLTCFPCFLAHTLYLLIRPCWRRARKMCRK